MEGGRKIKKLVTPGKKWRRRKRRAQNYVDKNMGRGYKGYK
jgi:hypothetical protein